MPVSRHPWMDVIRRSWKEALRIDLSQIMTLQALRGSMSIVLPLVIGIATGYTIEGATVAGGAALWTVVNTTSASHGRLRVLFLSCVSMAAGAFLGSVIGTIPLLPILVVGLAAFVAGLLVAVSIPVTMIGIQAVVGIVILTSFARDPLHALLQALLVFVGALFAFLIETLFSPWRRTGAERKSLARSFTLLSEMASATSDILETSSQRLRVGLVQSQAILFDRDDHRPQGRALFAIYDMAEQMRLLLLVVHQLEQALREQSTDPGEEINDLAQILGELSTHFQSVSKYLLRNARSKGGEKRPVPSNERLAALLAQAQQWQSSSPEQQALFQNVLTYCERMVRLWERIELLAQTWRSPDPKVLAEYTIHHHSVRAELANVWAILTANLTGRSTTFRHAVRLGVTLALATILYHIPGWPLALGYWIPFTAFLVLKPDFNTTLTRSASRVIGTLLGVILATVLLEALKPTPTGLVVIIAITAFVTLATFFVNYALYSVIITIAAVCLLALVAPHPLINGIDRGIDTLIGGVLALLMFLIWPTWEHTRIYANLAARVDTLRKHFLALMENYIHPEASHTEQIERAHRESRLAVTNVEASLERATREPSAPSFDAVQIHGLLEALNSISLNVLALEGYLLNDVTLPAATRAHLSLFVKEVDKTMQHISHSLAIVQPTTISCVGINVALHRLIEAEASVSSAQEVPVAEQSFLLKEAEQMARTLEIISQLLPIAGLEYETT